MGFGADGTLMVVIEDGILMDVFGILVVERRVMIEKRLRFVEDRIE